MKDNVEEYVPLLVKASSYPVGAVTVMLEDRLLPDTVNVCVPDAEPEQAEKAVSEPDKVIDGVELTTSFSAAAIGSEEVPKLPPF